MSPAPRPYSHSPSRRGSNGSEDHSDDGSGLTTSMCPLRISDRPAPVRGQVAVTLALPSTSQLNGDAAGLAREGRGVERHVDRVEAEARERAAHDVLAGRLGAEQRPGADEVLEQRLGLRPARRRPPRGRRRRQAARRPSTKVSVWVPGVKSANDCRHVKPGQRYSTRPSVGKYAAV